MEIKRGRAPDFIVAIGDDTSDEEMFRYFHKKKNEIRKNIKVLFLTYLECENIHYNCWEKAFES